jgi:hypothetical protein
MFLTLLLTLAADPTDPVAALKPLGPLVGEWKGTGTPDGPKPDRDKGFWSETVRWEWRFDNKDPRLVGTVENGKHYKSFVIRYKPADKSTTLTATTTDKAEQLFTGTLTVGKQKEPVLTVERTTDANATERLVLTVLHHNRYLYRLESKPAGVTAFARKYQVGVTKQGESFADVPKGPECVVSGGLAKIPVTYKGATYYVCCSGCKDAFLAEPEKYIK